MPGKYFLVNLPCFIVLAPHPHPPMPTRLPPLFRWLFKGNNWHSQTRSELTWKRAGERLRGGGAHNNPAVLPVITLGGMEIGRWLLNSYQMKNLQKVQADNAVWKPHRYYPAPQPPHHSSSEFVAASHLFFTIRHCAWSAMCHLLICIHRPALPVPSFFYLHLGFFGFFV